MADCFVVDWEASETGPETILSLEDEDEDEDDSLSYWWLNDLNDTSLLAVS